MRFFTSEGILDGDVLDDETARRGIDCLESTSFPGQADA